MNEPKRRLPILPGILLILLGIWLLARQLDLPLFRGDVVWPWLIVVLGIIIWVRYIFFPPRSSEDVFWGTAALLAGGFLLAWRNGLFLSQLEGWGTLWPMIPLIIGISALVEWLFAIRKWGSLITAIGFGAAGIVGLAYTTGSITSAEAWAIARFWPLLIVLIGLGFLIQGILGRKSGPSR